MKRILLSIMLVTGFLSIAACAGLKKIPETINENNSCVAITVNAKNAGFNYVEKIKTEKVFFIKLNNKEDSLKQNNLLLSNFQYEPFIIDFHVGSVDSFIMNVEPGIYAAVGAIGSGITSGAKFYIYFPEDLIKKSIVEVLPNTMTYMGKYYLSRGFILTRINKTDEVQDYYYSNMLFGEDNHNFGQRFIPFRKPSIFQAPKLECAENSIDDEIKFLNKHLDTFDETGWKDKINNRLQTINQ